MTSRTHAEQDEQLPQLMPELLHAIINTDHSLWQPLRTGVHACCSFCLPCIVGFHGLHEELEARKCMAMADILAIDAAERLQHSLQQAAQQMANEGEDEYSRMRGIMALLEVLAFWRFLGDIGALLARPASKPLGICST
jgi:hypothetical protein